MIVVTGAAGFIGSCLVSKLNQEGYKDLILVDDFTREEKERNYKHKLFAQMIPRGQFSDAIRGEERFIKAVFHLGARTDTTDMNPAIFSELNFNYSKEVWKVCVRGQIPMFYASSAATYGDGTLGFSDNPDLLDSLRPLNPYAHSKNNFDKWMLTRQYQPPIWIGLKFFNVYGPNEYHKKRMASVVFHAFNQIAETGKLKLFKSHKPEYADGEQMRDFIYVKDVIDVLIFLMKNTKNEKGIYNLGTGQARSFNDLAKIVFKNMMLSPDIEYIDTPMDIRDSYQYHTEADMTRFRAELGYNKPFTSLEQGITDYVGNYLLSGKYY